MANAAQWPVLPPHSAAYVEQWPTSFSQSTSGQDYLPEFSIFVEFGSNSFAIEVWKRFWSCSRVDSRVASTWQLLHLIDFVVFYSLLRLNYLVYIIKRGFVACSDWFRRLLWLNLINFLKAFTNTSSLLKNIIRNQYWNKLQKFMRQVGLWCFLYLLIAFYNTISRLLETVILYKLSYLE